MSTVRACTVFDCCRSHRVKLAVFPIDFGVGCPPHQLYVDKKTLILGMKPSGPVSSFIPREARAGQAYLPPVVQSAGHVEMSVCVWRDSRLHCSDAAL